MKNTICLKYIFLATLFVLFHNTLVVAQAIEARISTDTSEMLIGDQIQLTLSVAHSPNVKVEWPMIIDTLAGFDIVDQTAIESTQAENKIIEFQQFTLTSFDSGYYRIPPIDIPYTIEGSDDPKATFTNATSITVFTVAVDTTQDIKSIKEIIGEPLTFQDVLPYLILGLVAILLIGGLIWYFIRRKKDQPIIPSKPKPQIPPHEIAMRKLAQLESKKLWQKDDIKGYYIELTDVLREYMEGRFKIAALESITDEIISDLRNIDLKPKQVLTVRGLLEMADLAKFAKFKPSQGDNLKSMDIVRDFVKETKSWEVKKEAVEEINNENETIAEAK